jgi:Soluble lytic murein transglycosylase and related regulatory proteins (some contain LysM/invasin domains)
MGVMKHKKLKRLRYIIIFLLFIALIVLVLDNTAHLMFPLKYKEYITEYSKKNKVDPYLVLAVIKVESNFDPDAVSRKNARGLMQISEKTGAWGAEKLKLESYNAESLFDPETNISLGCWYLNVLSKEFNGNQQLILAAYNGGSGNVNDWLKNEIYSSSGKSLDKIPFKETEIYVKKVQNYLLIYKKLYENFF